MQDRRVRPKRNHAGPIAAHGRADTSFGGQIADGYPAKGFNPDEPMRHRMVKKKKSKKTAKKKVYYSGRKEKRAKKR
jgi:hypothetical protein